MEKRGANKILPRITAFTAITADWSTRWLPRRATQTTRTAGLEDPYYSDIANRRSSADTFFRHLAEEKGCASRPKGCASIPLLSCFCPGKNLPGAGR
jgi:hypothetical protein